MFSYEHVRTVQERKKRIELTKKIEIVKQELEDSKVYEAIRQKKRQLADASIMNTLKVNTEKYSLRLDA